MGKHVKTYGEIQYYLYDNDKKERKVSRDSFMNSKDVTVYHNSPKPKQQTTTSLTGKVIEKFNDFCNEYNGPNLPLDYNVNYDQGKEFVGGDGPSGTQVPRTHEPNIKNNKLDRGHKEDKERKRKREENRKEQKIAKMMDYQTTDDITRFAPEKQPHVHA